MTMQAARLRQAAADTMRQRVLRGLVAYWPLDEAAGAVRKAALWTPGLSPTAFELADHATVAQVAGPSKNLPLAAGFTAASGQFLDVADSQAISIQNTDFTCACWYQSPAGLYTNGFPTIVGQYGGAANRSWFLGVVKADLHLSSQMSTDGTAANATPSNADNIPVAGTWSFVVIRGISSVGALRLQCGLGGGPLSVNRVSGIVAAGGPFDSTANFQIGANNSVNQIDGSAAHVGLWRRYVTDYEIDWLYNAGTGRDLRRTA